MGKYSITNSLNELNTSHSGSYSISFSFYTADDAEDGANAKLKQVVVGRNNVLRCEGVNMTFPATCSNNRAQRILLEY